MDSEPVINSYANSSKAIHTMKKLLYIVQHLSIARNLESVISIVRQETRELTGADGATFVLRDGHYGNYCYYAEEDAIEPLWKGKQFPLDSCISDWVMQHAESVIIPDINKDPRIPHDAYRPTFVKSLAMVPIRKESPIGVVGVYWATYYRPTHDELDLLQALADSISIAIENIQVYSNIETHLNEMTSQEEKYRLLSIKLQESLDEKKALLKEIYHRVKNNLQVVTSLICLQAQTEKDASIRKSLIVTATRVKTMAIVHEMLYQSENMVKIDMNLYVQNLANYLYEIYNINPEHILFSVDCDEVIFKIDFAIPCGMIINELISNAFKHAFKESTRGEVRVSLKRDDNKIILIIHDNGSGISNTINIQKPNSLGMQLIINLTKQLQGNINLSRDNGTKFVLSFPYNTLT